tara:strand:- start:635 stop:1594 length:960 start_codon:yes stop_codon:yes gene_type:complete
MNNSDNIIKNDEIDFKELFIVLWNDRFKILKILLICIFLGFVYLFKTPKLYMSSISIYPAKETNNSKLNQFQGFASTLGIDMSNNESPYNIPDIIESRKLKKQLIYKKWYSEKYSDTINLINYWGIDKVKNASIESEIKALSILNSRISVLEGKSGLISIKVEMEEPGLARDIANFIYPAIVKFTTEKHLAFSKLNLEFINERQEEIMKQLASAEEELKKFRERNRSIVESPKLQLEMERLLRTVEIQKEVFITLQQQYELARIEQVKESPSVVILDDAMLSLKSHYPNVKIIILTILILGIFLGILNTLFSRLLKEVK